MKYSIAKMQAIKFYNKTHKPIKIAKANKQEDYCLLFENETPSKNYKIIEIINSEINK